MASQTLYSSDNKSNNGKGTNVGYGLIEDANGIDDKKLHWLSTQQRECNLQMFTCIVLSYHRLELLSSEP